MEQNLKELLLKDLCARLPYGVKVTNGIHTITLTPCSDTSIIIKNEHILPYLRPMSSMTEKEAEKYFSICTGSIRGDMIAKIDFYIKHHFDFRLTAEGLSMIEAGLALEAPKELYL